MHAETRNIYQTARRAAGYTQEAAAERLAISVESIRAYETDRRVPPNDVVELMAIMYHADYLPYQHLSATNKLYASVVPDVPQYDLLQSSARLTNRLCAFAESHADRRLMRMAEDNKIDSSERPEFDAILEDLSEIVELALALRCADSGKECTK